MGDLARLLCQYASKSIGASGICRSGCWISRSRGSLGRVAWVLTSLQFTQSSLTCRTHRTDLGALPPRVELSETQASECLLVGQQQSGAGENLRVAKMVSMSWAASMGDAVVAHAPVAAALRGCAFRSDFLLSPCLGVQLEVGTHVWQTCTCMMLLRACRSRHV